MIPKAIVCGEMHYPRIVPEQWRARLEMAYAMGLNAVSTYVFWNIHEPRPGVYDFEGPCDVAAYVRLAAECGLDVVLRPGPYVCAEWDFGGLPAWLLAGDVSLRTLDESYLLPVRRWLARLGEELAPLQRSRGGPIVAVQLENEYGAFGNDPHYLRALRDALAAAGFGESPFYTIDQARDLAAGALDDVPIGATFGPGEPEKHLAAASALRPGELLICGEYWDGWFDHWGEPHARLEDAQQVRDVEWMLRNGCSLNFYMFCGGTNFGFNNGANGSGDVAYQPDTTSYDYLAPLDEAGRPTPKYFAFRETIAAATGTSLRPVPAQPQLIEIPSFELTESAPLASALGDPVEVERPVPMERIGQSFGYILYRTTLSDPGEGVLEIGGLHDYATVLVDGSIAGYLDRRLRESFISLNVPRTKATLDILVENCGRINYGPLISGERKGIVGDVRFRNAELTGWQVFSLPLDGISGLRFGGKTSSAPAFYRGTFALAEPGDTYLDTSRLGKGILFVNGRNAGRYWRIGPQQALYVPGAWLRPGRNEAVVFDVTIVEKPLIRGAREPIISL
ncbi:MAG TPA: beta-galactosidase family protein [Candidatus Cybelea sp.]|nr:beta-galactosidase family protein [Candidatus Cybelea sp.]